MDTRSTGGAGDDTGGIPDDLRCKRSDGKQWRCTALSMPDKTVCEKHYIQAKKRAANSAMKASMKKKGKSMGEGDSYYENKSDDMDGPLSSSKVGDYPGSFSGKNYKEKFPKNHIEYSPEAASTKVPLRSSLKLNDDLPMDNILYEENHRSYRIQLPSAVDSSRSRSQKMPDSSPMTETSEASSEASDETVRQPCHQCKQIRGDRIIWCLNCDRRGYCENCISTWYSDLPLEDIQKLCPVCRGSCSCKMCLRGDNLIKARIRDIPAQDKLQHLYCLLSAVLPVVKQIQHEQTSEVELESRLEGSKDLARTKLNADEQMCCNYCRIPIIDYHRHCPSCSYDLCLSCCKDIREATRLVLEGETASQVDGEGSAYEQLNLSNVHRNLFKRYSDWRVNADGSIPCPPREYGGCGHSILMLKRIFKMNWVAIVAKNAEELVSGCKVSDSCCQEIPEFDPRLLQAAYRESDNDNFLYHPSAQDIKAERLEEFRIHWSRGEPVVVKEVCDFSTMEIWNPMVLLNGIRETADEKPKDPNRTVKAINYFDRTEVDIEITDFMKGYSVGKFNENGQRQFLKLKDWPSPSASEEFLMYQRPDFISKLPLLEFIHSKWGLLNVAAKLPHYSLQNDVGAKIRISYGTPQELDGGGSTENLHLKMHDMAFLLVHTCDVKPNIETVEQELIGSEGRRQLGDPQVSASEGSPKLATSGEDIMDEDQADVDPSDREKILDQAVEASSNPEEKILIGEVPHGGSDKSSETLTAGAHWDVFRRQDVPKLIEYLINHRQDFKMSDNNARMQHPVYDSAIYLNNHHKKMLKEELGIEPWSFDQQLGEAIFIPAGCPFQVKNLQSTIQLGLDFLSPESLSEANRLAAEIRGLPNDHEAKLQILEVGKISLYAASWAIKEVQKLVLDPK
ncbi:OLC1v1021637C2 [Oldenlandia corymbosa var. corymbosa]|nr:OLC1v1021637C2 [Oldenlandia corymbosa var. corymbosa]